MKSRCASWALVLLVAGCHDFPAQKEIITDLRVLAIRIDTPEVTVPPYSDAATEVVVTALVVDPRGGSVDYTWSTCPQTGDLGCTDPAWLDGGRGYEEQCFLLTSGIPGTLMPPILQPLYDPGANAAAFDDFAATVSSGVQAVPVTSPWVVSLPPLTLGVPRQLIYALMAEDMTCGLAGVWPQLQLTVHNHGASDEPLDALKRVIASYGDLRPIVETLGLPLCPADADAQGCFVLPPYSRNTNPRLSETTWRPGTAPDSATPFRAITGSGIPVAAGGGVRIKPSFADGCSEEYGQFAFDIETQEIRPARYREQLSVAWFITAGSLAENVTWALVTVGYDTAYNAPTAAEVVRLAGSDPQTIACADVAALFPHALPLYLVGRDDRGGVDWRIETLAVDLPADDAGWGIELERCH